MKALLFRCCAALLMLFLSSACSAPSDSEETAPDAATPTEGTDDAAPPREGPTAEAGRIEIRVDTISNFFGNAGVIAPKWVSNWGPIERMICDFDDKGRPRARVNFPLGNIADKASPHFDDQMEGWIEGAYQPLLFTREQVVAGTEATITLER